VGREDGRRLAGEDPIQIAGDGPQRIGVEHDRLVEPVEKEADERADTVASPEARS
jgi:hypothetical protein